MKVKLLNKYSVAAMLLLVAAAGLIAIALISRVGEFVSAAFVISGMICAITGIFLLTFSGGEPVDPHFVGILPVQGCINLCRIASDFGITGNAYFLPPRLTGDTRVMQFNPDTTYTGGMVSAKGSFPETGQKGLVTVPSCDPLIQDLRKRNGLVIPNNEEQLTQLLRETAGEIFELAPKVSVRWNGSRITITLHHYRFIDGCRIIAEGSRDCCTRNPCPACSLFGALIAEGTDKVVTLEQCSVSASHKDVIIIYSIVSGF
jgi:hypothetical protein